MSPQDFIATISAAAQSSALSSGIPSSFTIAEAALESSWGESQLAKQARNLFGVKADASWTGDTLTMNTREYLHGQWVMVPAKWRKYADWQGCMDDHAAFLHDNPRYAKCFEETTGDGFAHAVAAAGYATDPQYAQKIVTIIHAHNLAALD